jgi:oligoendopeptidase F
MTRHIPPPTVSFRRSVSPARRLIVKTFVAPLALLLALPASAVDRAQVPDKYKWKLQDLYPSDAAWAQAKEAFPKKLATMSRHEGHLGDSARALADALSDMGALQNELERLYVYAQARTDEDTREAKPRGMAAEVEQLAVKVEAATAWVRPAILALDEGRVRAFAKEEPRLRDWAFYLDNVLRWKPHTLSSGEEKIVAMTGDLATAAPSLHSVLTNADLPYPTVKLSTGESVRLDPAGYHRARASPRRADREKAFRSFFTAVKGYERTIGATLQAQVKAHVFEKDVRRFDSALESSLFDDAVPVAVYTQLVKDVNANLPTLHRYLALRKRMLRLDKLKYEDLYAPMVKEMDRKYTTDEAMALTLEAVKPLGERYAAALAKGFEAGWTDFMPATGKRSGAYSTGVYGVHPYQLLNYNGQWNDVSTLAHEAGHSMHTVLAFEKQPYPTSSYATFVAEVASTLNENLLLYHALSRTKDDRVKLSLLGEHLESLRTTLFRQTMFAEFELAVHELVEKGEALTGERTSDVYLALVRKYYGHDRGACEVADLYGVEWAYVPHFFNYDFYVFQYATSLVASTSLANAIREETAQGKTDARDRYLTLLAAGGSDYPVDLLRRAGVDMTTPAPFAAAMAEMNATMDEMEKILARQKGVTRGAGRAGGAAAR